MKFVKRCEKWKKTYNYDDFLQKFILWAQLMLIKC